MTASRPKDPSSPALSPAARALLDEIRSREGMNDDTPVHLAEVKERGLLTVLGELVAADEVLELERGHLTARTTYRECFDRLSGIVSGFDSRSAAALWRCSHGRSRSVLARMVRDGLAQRAGGRFSVAGDRREM